MSEVRMSCVFRGGICRTYGLAPIVSKRFEGCMLQHQADRYKNGSVEGFTQLS